MSMKNVKYIERNEKITISLSISKEDANFLAREILAISKAYELQANKLRSSGQWGNKKQRELRYKRMEILKTNAIICDMFVCALKNA